MSAEKELHFRHACKIVLKLVTEHIISDLEKKSKKKNRSVWVRKWIARRQHFGASDILLKELALEDPNSFKNHLRMSSDLFETLLQHVTPSIEKQNTTMRDALPARLKLQITLRYLGSGDSFASLQYLYRVPKCTISKFLPEVCDSIYSVLENYIKVPNTQEEWDDIKKGFSNRWNFPGCGGALDGKHVVLRAPFHSGSNFYNYKGSFSIILFALVDDQYCFKYIDVGSNGRASDGGIFSKSSLKNAVENNLLNMPPNTIFVADDAFPLKDYLLKPYSHHGPLTIKERVFNYRLSRARRIVENAFGILVSRFRIFEKPIALSPEKADNIVKTTCVLHNWLRMNSSSYLNRGCVDEEDHENGVIIDGTWRKEIRGLGLPDLTSASESNNYTKNASNIRNNLADWFMGDGAVPWQMNMLNLKK
ncbi:protein ALP1-like [Rhopalosiphum maidis]|uniref:protein ALP1-like n=1 Tax=Rhopalosiphum maidis TaxID=43146 RepID=UPI000EFF1C1E|nr:protein ALP1-like [Rhopalosiphum maidis]